jgi:NADH:ubiquinone oxidoreductase subunit 4 (subunit M)
MALWIGLYPKPFFEILETPVNQLVQTVRRPNGMMRAHDTPTHVTPEKAGAGN